MLKMWLLIAICLLCITVVLTQDTTVAVKHGENATLTFHMKTNTNKIMKLRERGINRMQQILAWANMTVTFSISNSYSITADVISVYINNVTKNDAGKYCADKNDAGKYCADTECTLLIVTGKPTTNLTSSSQQPVLQPVEGLVNELKGGLNLTCDATSTTKPDYHSLPMVYTWFKDGVFYTTSNSNILHDTNITIRSTGREITCTATDDPPCSGMLRSLTRGSSLVTVRDDPKCKGVLGVSTSFTLQPEYKPMDTEQQSYSEEVVNVGDTVKITREISAYPPPNLVGDSRVIPSGANIEDTNIFNLTEGDEAHHYNLMLTVCVISQQYMGIYCISVQNKEGKLTVCYVLKEAARGDEGITSGNTGKTTYLYIDQLNLHLSIGIGILVAILAVITIAIIMGHMQKGCFKPKKGNRKRRRTVYRMLI